MEIWLFQQRKLAIWDLLRHQMIMEVAQLGPRPDYKVGSENQRHRKLQQVSLKV
jgi:hypothetical protein